MQPLQNLLTRHNKQFDAILPEAIQFGKRVVLNLGENGDFADCDFNDVDSLIQRSQQILQQHQAILAIGQYGEPRFFYETIDGKAYANRLIHIGLDLTVPASTAIHSPLDATVHSFKNNRQRGDYGPTIVLQHQLDNIIFYTLYGHLSLDSIESLQVGQFIAKGQAFAKVGNPQENGHWPPHLHLQIIDDMQDHFGDFPGVVAEQDKQTYLKRCPNPEILLFS